MIEWMDVTEAEKKTGIPSNTVRRYIRNHGHHLKIRKKGKKYDIAEESLSTLKLIRELYNAGKNMDQVDETLSNKGIPVTITVTEDNQEIAINVAETLLEMKSQMDAQMELNESLINIVQDQKDYIDRKLEERDRRFMESIRSLQESKKELAASKTIDNQPTTNEKKWYHFWK